MDLKASRDTDEFGSVYSFDGLVNKIKKHNVVHPVATSPVPPTIPQRHPNDYFAGHRGSLTGSNGAAVTGNGFRRFSVFSQQLPPAYNRAPPLNGLYGLGGGINGGLIGNGAKLDGLSEGKGSVYGANSVVLDPPEKIEKRRLSQDPDYQKVGASCRENFLVL